MTKKEIEYEYDFLWAFADELLKLYNPCNFKKRIALIKTQYWEDGLDFINRHMYCHRSVFATLNCCVYRAQSCCTKTDRKGFKKYITSCCGVCNLLTKKGCPTKNIACKYYLCEYAHGILPSPILDLLLDIRSQINHTYPMSHGYFCYNSRAVLIDNIVKEQEEGKSRLRNYLLWKERRKTMKK